MHDEGTDAAPCGRRRRRPSPTGPVALLGASLLLLMAGAGPVSAYGYTAPLAGTYRPLRGSDSSFHGGGLHHHRRGRRDDHQGSRRSNTGASSQLSMQFGAGGGMMKKQSGGTPSFGTGGACSILCL